MNNSASGVARPCLWIDTQTDANITLMAQTLGISETGARILANRGLRSRNAAVMYLNPALKFLHDEALLTDMGKAVLVVGEAVASGKQIVVYGDYDVDGVTSVAILVKMLRALGGEVRYYIPGRETEGYGMNLAAVEALAHDGAELIITCDNGISANREIARAKELGMEVVVIDHHETDGALPPANAIVDPKRPDCDYPFKHLCAAALCYKFAHALSAEFGVEYWERLETDLLILAGFGTICDIVPLIGENRIIATNALAAMNRGHVYGGLRALFAARGLLGKVVSVRDMGFVLGPCINAAGRLDRADLAVELFLSDDENRASALAERLSALNDQRKLFTEAARERAAARLCDLAGDKVYVVFDEEAPESVSGIVAGRIKDQTGHPVIMLSRAKESGLVKGSGRSIKGYNLFAALHAHRELFERFGGHEMAAGLTMREEHIAELSRRLNADCALVEDDFAKKLHVDAWLKPAELTMPLAAELARLEPFGSDNPEPLFAVADIRCENLQRIGANKKTLRFTFEHKLQGIAFGKFDDFCQILTTSLGQDTVNAWLSGQPLPRITMDIAFHLNINEYNGLTSVQLNVADFRSKD